MSITLHYAKYKGIIYLWNLFQFTSFYIRKCVYQIRHMTVIHSFDVCEILILPYDYELCVWIFLEGSVFFVIWLFDNNSVELILTKHLFVASTLNNFACTFCISTRIAYRFSQQCHRTPKTIEILNPWYHVRVNCFLLYLILQEFHELFLSSACCFSIFSWLYCYAF